MATHTLLYDEPGGLKRSISYEDGDASLIAWVAQNYVGGRFPAGSSVEFAYNLEGGPIRVRIGDTPRRVWRLWLEILRMRGHAPLAPEDLED